MENIKLGKYQHFKGGVYEVIGVARHSETLEEMIVYKSEEGEFWVRPKKCFLKVFRLIIKKLQDLNILENNIKIGF